MRAKQVRRLGAGVVMALALMSCGSDGDGGAAKGTTAPDITVPDPAALALADYCAQPEAARTPDTTTAAGIETKLANLTKLRPAVPDDLVDDLDAAIPLLEAIHATFVANGDGAASLEASDSAYQVFLAAHPEAKAANEAISAWLGDACSSKAGTTGRGAGRTASGAAADAAKVAYCAEVAASGPADLTNAAGVSAALARLQTLRPAVPADLTTDFAVTIELLGARVAAFELNGDTETALTADDSPYKTFVDANPTAPDSQAAIAEWAAAVCS